MNKNKKDIIEKILAMEVDWHFGLYLCFDEFDSVKWDVYALKDLPLSHLDSLYKHLVTNENKRMSYIGKFVNTISLQKDELLVIRITGRPLSSEDKLKILGTIPRSWSNRVLIIDDNVTLTKVKYE